MFERIMAQNAELNQKVVALQTQVNAKTREVTTIEDLLLTYSEDQRELAESLTAPTIDYAASWTRTLNWFRISRNLKEAHEKGFAGEEPSARAQELADLLPLVKQLTKTGAKLESPSKQKGSTRGRAGTRGDAICGKCKRPGHETSKCYAKTSIEGKPI
jgi:hypothetical protein